MKALKFVETRKGEYVTAEKPQCGDKQVLIEVKVAGICHSDIMSYEGKHPWRIPPVITGHEFSGVIVEAGQNVQDFSVGDRVVVEPHIGCGECEYCRKGVYNLCNTKRFIGVGDWSGCFGEYVIAEPSMCLKMPGGMSFEEAAALEPYCVGEHAVDLAGSGAGESALIIGGGTIGLMTLLSLKNRGVEKVYVSDISAEKREYALKAGAAGTVDPMTEDLFDKMMADTEGAGVDNVFICVPVPPVLNQSLSVAKKKGKVVVIAVFGNPVEIDVKNVQVGERSVLGSNMYTIRDYRNALADYEAGKLNLGSMITKTIGFDELNGVIARLSDGELQNEIKIQVVF